MSGESSEKPQSGNPHTDHTTEKTANEVARSQWPVMGDNAIHQGSINPPNEKTKKR